MVGLFISKQLKPKMHTQADVSFYIAVNGIALWHRVRFEDVTAQAKIKGKIHQLWAGPTHTYCSA
jgi:hypothetical protein